MPGWTYYGAQAKYVGLQEEASSFDGRAGTRHRPTVADDHVGLVRGPANKREVIHDGCA